MKNNKIATMFDKQRIPGIRSIKKYPAIDQEKFKTYGPLFIQKYFLNDGKKPNKMVGFGSKSKSLTDPVVFILYDLKMQPAVFFEFKSNYDIKGFLNFVGKLITKTKFTFPKKVIGEQEIKVIDNISISENAVEKWSVAQGILSGLLILTSVYMLLSFYFKAAKYAAQERYAATTVENDLNKELFEGQQQKESGFEMFANLENYLQMVINKKMNSLILCGPPGMSKTYMVRRTLYFAQKKPGSDYVIEKGSSLGLNSVYQLLYNNRTKLLILDDFDTPLSNEDIVNLMKAVTDSYGKRIVSLSPEKTESTQDSTMAAAPAKFEFTGQLIIITNKKKEQLDMALRSRSPVVEVNFDTKQIMTAMDKLIKFVTPQVPLTIKMEVLDYIKTLQKNDTKVNITFRSVKASVDARMGNPDDWKTMVRLIVDYKGKRINERATDYLEKIYLS